MWISSSVAAAFSTPSAESETARAAAIARIGRMRLPPANRLYRIASMNGRRLNALRGTHSLRTRSIARGPARPDIPARLACSVFVISAGFSGSNGTATVSDPLPHSISTRDFRFFQLLFAFGAQAHAALEQLQAFLERQVAFLKVLDDALQLLQASFEAGRLLSSSGISFHCRWMPRVLPPARIDDQGLANARRRDSPQAASAAGKLVLVESMETPSMSRPSLFGSD